MTVQELQDYVFTAKYSRYNPEKKRRESFEEATKRVMDMHREHFKRKGVAIDDLINEVEDAMKRRLVLGSQRALQFGGEPILKKNARLYNCTTSYCDRIRFFQEALWLLLCGCGVGFSVQWHHIDRLPALQRPQGEPYNFFIEDTIEGWSDALGVLIESYLCPDKAPVSFHYDNIRPQGEPIASGSGKAPGPEPLKRSLTLIQEVIESALSNGQEKLKPIDAYDIMMHASDAVLSGGVRRSATICMFSPDDEEMAKAKTGNWFIENPQRARSNNSAVLLRSETSREQFDGLIKQVRDFGEPGFVWADDRDITYNPCVEIGLYPQIDGVSGWAFCNLCEINMGAVNNEADFEHAARAAAILGTLQADYTTFNYLGEVSERIAQREALLGVSMTGMMEQPELAFDPKTQQKMAKLILEVNEHVAEKIGINPAARSTCVKPAGTTSCILGTSSGIHPHHARRYFRRAQANRGEPIVQYFNLHNPKAVEQSVWNPNGTDVVITFCIEAKENATIKKELSAVGLLEHVRKTKLHWIDAGKRDDRCVKPWLSHNVSNTVTVKDDEWDEIADYIYTHRDHFAGISLLADGGDLDYPQAPFVEVWAADEIVDLYGVGAIMSSGLIVDGMKVFDDNLWAACDCALSRGEDLNSPIDSTLPKRVYEAVHKVQAEKRDWVRRAHKFAKNYFDDDILRMTRCLKRVHTCKQWEDLQRQYTKVDYTLLNEEEDNTTLEETIACAGGNCDII